MEIENLTTEKRNPHTMDIDSLDTLEMVKRINEEDKKVAEAVSLELPQIAEAVDKIAERFKKGGRIIYCGAGTSGRLGTLDAIELTPTYGVPAERAFGMIAGGKEAMFTAVEGAEDSEQLAIDDLKTVQLRSDDIVIGVAASGRTPYTISALTYGNQLGALTISVTCNKNSDMTNIAQISIAPIVGPEVITGSTRMKAGSAQKMVLNMISTGVMIKTGKVYQNLMINVQPTNEKLVQRAINIIHEATLIGKDEISSYLEAADYQVNVAIVMIKLKVSAQEARQLLLANDGKIIDILNKNNREVVE